MREEEKKTVEDATKYKLLYFWGIILAFLLMSMGINDFILNEDGQGSYLDYMFVSPFSDDEVSKNFFHKNWPYTVFMLLVTITMRFFFFGNPKKKYIQKLENIKRAVLEYVPFYFDGKDTRNNYIRFGMQTAFKNGFLERKISQGQYLKQVKYLNIFTGSNSPDIILNLKTNYITDSFLSYDRYVEVFKIIEGYIGGNIDIVKDVPFKKYWAIGTNEPMYSDESILTFIKVHIPKEKSKRFPYTKKEATVKCKALIKKIKDLDEKEQIEYKKKFILHITNKKTQTYKNHVFKMVVFSPLAVKEAVEIIEKEARRFLLKHKKLRTALMDKINEYGEIDEEKFIEILKFLSFYKIINLFMGLPSGIVTARVEDYTLSRIIDDVELFEKSRTIRQIKPMINDKRGKYDDTEARAYMIFHHEFFLNSLNAHPIKKIFDKFDALRTISLEEMPDINLKFEGTEEEKLQYIQTHQIEDGWVYKPIKVDKNGNRQG